MSDKASIKELAEIVRVKGDSMAEWKSELSDTQRSYSDSVNDFHNAVNALERALSKGGE